MHRSPIRDFACVITLLSVMAIGVFVTTGKVDSKATPPPTIQTPPSTSTTLVSVDARIIFSHRPSHLFIQQAGKDTPDLDLTPTGNEIDFSIKLPADQITEFLIDVQWPETPDDSKYFTQITYRQNQKEDQVILFSDQSPDFADTFSIDTH